MGHALIMQIGDKVKAKIPKAGGRGHYSVTGKLVGFGRIFKGKVFEGKGKVVILRDVKIEGPVEVRGEIKKA